MPYPTLDTSETDPQPGDHVAGRYEVERVLGRGGMGTVLLAKHLFLQQRVALKIMRRAVLDDGAVRRFEREARVAFRLRSEHVARVLDAGRTERGEPFIAMEHLDGCDLEALLEQRGRIPVGEAAAYVLQACSGLAEAHALGVVHRDLKPGNLFLTRRPDGSALVKILDFGIARPVGEAAAELEGHSITNPATPIGSPAFMSPEQIRTPRDVDGRSDLWSLGVTLYRLCAGRPPFGGGSVTEVLAKVLTEPPERLPAELGPWPPDFVAFLDRALEKDRARRPGDVAAFAAALAPLAGTAPPPPRTAAAAPGARIGPGTTVPRVSPPRTARSDAATARAPGLPPRAEPVSTTSPTSMPAASPPRPRRTALLVPVAIAAVGAVALTIGRRDDARRAETPRPAPARADVRAPEGRPAPEAAAAPVPSPAPAPAPREAPRPPATTRPARRAAGLPARATQGARRPDAGARLPSDDDLYEHRE